MITSKSPRKVLEKALAVGQEVFPAYAHKNSPRKFTQPQLFACLVLKEHQKKDYRGIVALLADSELHKIIGLKHIPHFTTLQKASQRLLKIDHVRRLLATTIHHVRTSGKVAHAAGDSSGFESRHASRYYVWRRDSRKDPDEKKNKKRPKKRVSYKQFGKLMAIVCCVTHAILAAVASEGPTPDVDQLDEVVGQLPESIDIGHLLLDSGFDSGHNHELLREELGIMSTIPPWSGRPPKDPDAQPSNKHRREMKRKFKNGSPTVYGKRAQAETVFSMMKRNLGSELRGRSNKSRRIDIYLRVLTHNIMLALLRLFYRAFTSPLHVSFTSPFHV